MGIVLLDKELVNKIDKYSETDSFASNHLYKDGQFNSNNKMYSNNVLVQVLAALRGKAVVIQSNNNTHYIGSSGDDYSYSITEFDSKRVTIVSYIELNKDDAGMDCIQHYTIVIDDKENKVSSIKCNSNCLSEEEYIVLMNNLIQRYNIELEICGLKVGRKAIGTTFHEGEYSKVTGVITGLDYESSLRAEIKVTGGRLDNQVVILDSKFGNIVVAG